MKGLSLLLSLPASPWDMSNWYNWFWWLPDEKAQINKKEDVSNEIPRKEETLPEVKPKPKRKKRTTAKKITKSQDAIELVLRPAILEELEKEAMISDSTINQVIQIILEAHIESKGSQNIQTDVWKCNFCDPEREFRDYFEFSEHFFNQHMQPGLQKISEFKPEQ